MSAPLAQVGGVTVDSDRCKASRRNEHVNAPQRAPGLDYAEMLA